MTDLPPALTERCVELMRLLDAEQYAILLAEKTATTARHELANHEAELRGIDAAAEAFLESRDRAVNPTDMPQEIQRRPRRDIRALVKGYYDMPRSFTPTPELCAAHIGCRVAQVEAALRAINGAGAEE